MLIVTEPIAVSYNTTMLKAKPHTRIALTLLLTAALALAAWQLALAQSKGGDSQAAHPALPIATSIQRPLATPGPLIFGLGDGPGSIIFAPGRKLPLLPNAFIHRQQHPLSCEAAAAYVASTMLGVRLDEDAILAALPRDPNPNLGFRGNVDGPTGGTDDYGVYAPPIVIAINQLGGVRGLQARQISGEVELRAEVAKGHPVVVWITSNLRPGLRLPQPGYYLVRGEHAVTVIGIDSSDIIASDVGGGQPRIWPMSQFLNSWKLFDYQGVAFSRK